MFWVLWLFSLLCPALSTMPPPRWVVTPTGERGGCNEWALDPAHPSPLQAITHALESGRPQRPRAIEYQVLTMIGILHRLAGKEAWERHVSYCYGSFNYVRC